MSRINYIPASLVPVSYGLLYNGHTILDSRNLAAAGWHVITRSEIITLLSVYDSTPLYGTLYECSHKLNEAGTTHWNNAFSNNESGLSYVGNGFRESEAAPSDYYNFRTSCHLWTSTLTGAYLYNVISQNQSSTQYVTTQADFLGRGLGVRLVRDTASIAPGQMGFYTGNNGKKYTSMLFAGLEILTTNLIETRFRNGDLIPLIDDQTAWRALTTAAYCFVNGDQANQ